MQTQTEAPMSIAELFEQWRLNMAEANSSEHTGDPEVLFDRLSVIEDQALALTPVDALDVYRKIILAVACDIFQPPPDDRTMEAQLVREAFAALGCL